MDLNDLHKVWEVKTLKKPGEAEARAILERIAKQVQPIMRRRRWKVKLLTEFSPANPSLLGLNVGGGTVVKIRLRRPHRDHQFLPYVQVLDTMLHELCHIDQGPHNAAFYALWDDVRKECEDLITSGVTGTGQGFDLPGKRLGGSSRQPRLTDLRQVALAAAEKRQRIASLLPSGARRLGGNSDIMDALSPVQAAAMAAERRMKDELWCGSSSSVASTSVIDHSHVSESVEDCVSGKSRTFSSSGKRPFEATSISKNGSLGGLSVKKKNGTISAVHPPFSNATPTSGRSHGASNHTSLACGHANHILSDQAGWECGICTLINKPISLICEACGIQRPIDLTSTFKFWACKFCTLDNTTDLDKCSACGQWRYSCGAPASTRGPHFET